MADKTAIFPNIVTDDAGAPLKVKFKDNGDGTWSLSTSVAGSSTGDSTATGNLTALASTVDIPMAGFYGVAVNFGAGLVGTVAAYLSTDGGTTYDKQTMFYDPFTQQVYPTLTNPSGSYAIVVIGGTSNVRVKPTAYTSGSSAVKLRATTAQTLFDVTGTHELDRIDPINDSLVNLPFGHSFVGITTATTTTIFTGSGVVDAIVLLGGTAGAITGYDNTAGSGTQSVPTFTPGSVSTPVVVRLNERVSTGFTVVTAAATVVLVLYRVGP